MARILLGVSGGIAAYKALEFVRLATAAGHAVRVIQTPTSERFVGQASFAALTGAPVLTSEFERDPARGAFPDQEAPSHDPLNHLELVRNADALLVAPASANTIAKLAAGLADNLLTSAALAATCPVLVAPAMNNAMYEHPATRANLATLRDRGVAVLEPEVGALGSKGEWGVGRLREPPELLAAVGADYRPATTAGEKLKKEAADELDLRLERTEDVLAALAGARRPGQTLVGFAAEHGEGAVELARGKLERKGLDLVVVNDISRADIGFEVAENEVTIVGRGAERAVARASKAEVAGAILDAVEQQRSGGEYNYKHGAPGAPGGRGAARA